MHFVVYRPAINHGEFQKEATKFGALHGTTANPCEFLALEGTTIQRRKVFREKCASLTGQEVRSFVYFGHGWSKGLTRFYSNYTLPELADNLVLILAPDATVVLYACLTGKGYGFADRLQQQLQERGLDRVRVVSHLLRGHTTRMPYCEWSGEGKNHTGVPIIYRKDPLWPKWLAALKTRFRFEYPFLSKAEIFAHLKGEEPERCPECGQVIA